MNKLQTVLQKPYPLEERKWAKLKLAFLLGGVVFLFLFLFNPFGNKDNLLLNAAYAGVLTFAAIIINFLLLFPLFPGYFKEEMWTIGREIILTFIIITTIASLNMLAGSIFWSAKLSAFNWLRMIFYTAVIGVAPATVSILLNQARLLKKYRGEVKQINEQLQPVNAVEPVIEIKADIEKAEVNNNNSLQFLIEAENPKDNLTITPSNFLAAASADNYVKIYYAENDKLKTAMLRTTLKKLEDSALVFPHFFRCHRTAIVNIAAVENLSGTAQGYRLHLTNLPETIPVSRNLNQVIKEKLAAIRPSNFH
jgi:LytTr DNA-binding domain